MDFLKFWKILKLAGIFECEIILGNMRLTILLQHAKHVYTFYHVSQIPPINEI